MAEAERLRQSLLADAGRGDLLKTIIDRVELRPNGLRMILSLVPLTPAAAPPNRLQGCVFTREFPLRIKRRGVEMRLLLSQPGLFSHFSLGQTGPDPRRLAVLAELTPRIAGNGFTARERFRSRHPRLHGEA